MCLLLCVLDSLFKVSILLCCDISSNMELCFSCLYGPCCVFKRTLVPYELGTRLFFLKTQVLIPFKDKSGLQVNTKLGPWKTWEYFSVLILH